MTVIVSMNVRGLQDNKKHKEIFVYCKNLDFDIIFMQETHSTPDMQHIWESEWGGKILCAHGDSTACGTAILLNPKIQCNVIKTKLDVEHENKTLTF